MKLLPLYTISLLAITGCTFNAKNEPKPQEVRLALQQKIATLDPRLAQDLTATNISRMLFEGLTFIDEHGKIFPGCASKIQISQDLKTYTFTLRDLVWSNGDKVTAADFEESWKSMLDPSLKAPMAYMLFDIKGAKSYYEGKSSRDAIGILAVDDSTLIVTLEKSSSYFLQLTSTAAYLPVNQKWVQDTNSALISNGPFKLATFVPGEKLEVVKNEKYWGNAAVKLTGATIGFMDDSASLDAFEKGSLDWVGSPFSTLSQAGQAALNPEKKLSFSPAAGTQFLRLKVTKAPFTSPKMRQALMCACNRQDMITTIMQGPQLPAGSLVPPAMGVNQALATYDLSKAQMLFEEALLDMGITRNDLPGITFTYITSDRMQKLAEYLAHCWKAAFGIDVTLEGTAENTFYEKILTQNYQIAAGAWFADYYDPMSFLSVFETKDNGLNCTGWENATYTQLLADSNLEIDPTKRMVILQKALDIITDEAPVVPLFYFSFPYGKNDALKRATLSPMGLLDLDDAYFER
ncbi:MAG: peptide ABC transporter substrate-binding protein [Verrucomicrobia bacterium]|nr:peptide ABC transporter substrate-binding protein [Verrucomicrobiota bacterium]MBS0636871.1 peptide ABC transporter substrate-binding protein [Verrucomicrobiota bacterium]